MGSRRTKRRNYGRNRNKQLKIDETTEQLFNEDKANFLRKLISSNGTNAERKQILLSSSSNDSSLGHTFHQNRKSLTDLFQSPVGVFNDNCTSSKKKVSFIITPKTSKYKKKPVKKNAQNVNQNKKQNYKNNKEKNKNAIVKEYTEKCPVNWSEIEDFDLVVEKVPKNTRNVVDNLLIHSNSVNQITQDVRTVPNIDENLIPKMKSSDGVEPVHSIEYNNITQNKHFVCSKNNQTNSIKSVSCVSSDFGNVSSLKEVSSPCSEYAEINTLRHQTGLATSTPNVTPTRPWNGKNSCYLNELRNFLGSKPTSLQQCSKYSITEDVRSLEIKLQQLINRSSISTLHQSLTVSDVKPFQKTNNYDIPEISRCPRPITENSDEEHEYSLYDEKEFPVFPEHSSKLCTMGSSEQNMSCELFSSLTQFESSQQPETFNNMQMAYVENKQSNKEIISKSSTLLTANRTEFCNSDGYLYAQCISIAEDEIEKTSASSCREIDNSVTYENRSLSQELSSVCRFNSYGEFTSFIHNVSICPEKDLKRFLSRHSTIPSNSLELGYPKNIIEDHPDLFVLALCNQREILSFDEVITADMTTALEKIGEGSYGEVFCVSLEEDKKVFKILPIEGDIIINGEKQQTFREIISEILISLELGGLVQRSDNATSSFIKVNRICCVRGSYPTKLLQCWDEYDAVKISENDRPDVFPSDQLFIIFEFVYGGQDLESAQLHTIAEAKSVFQQLASALAVAEQAVHFEHRDLHWGNILIAPTEKKMIEYIMQEERFCVPSAGVVVSIIDFTLSYLKTDGCALYYDLSEDVTLFMGEGDYQFDIYRKMKEHNENNWITFSPYSNILWLHYVLNKLLEEKSYQTANQRLKHQLQKWQKTILNYKSVTDFVKSSNFFKV